jgi:Zn-dependent protease
MIACVAGGIDIPYLAVSIVVLLLSLSLHESAHAWMADRFGDPTGRLLGRVSLNPLPHIDPIGTLLFPLIGMLAGGVMFGWAKPVPVNPANLRDPRRAHIFVSAAGPVSNLLAALVFLIGLRMLVPMAESGSLGRVTEPLLLLCEVGVYLNVILAVFNLLPIPPLDGSWILEGLLPQSLAGVFRSIRPFGFVLLLLLLYTGVFRAILNPVLSVVRDLSY